jgi:hypothetical protein
MLSRVARSHVCIACGHDLARLHAPPDPHYGLPVVVCPGCALACIRRPYTGVALWRSAMRVRRMVVRLFVRLVLLVLFPATVISSSIAIGMTLQTLLGRDPTFALLTPSQDQQAGLTEWLRYYGIWLLPLWLVASASTGIAFGFVFPHWRLRWWPIGVAAMALSVVFLLLLVIAPVEWAYDERSLTDAWNGLQANRGGAQRSLWVMGFAVAIAWAAMPTGGRLGRDLHTRKGLRSWRLKRARKRWSQG